MIDEQAQSRRISLRSDGGQWTRVNDEVTAWKERKKEKRNAGQ